MLTMVARVQIVDDDSEPDFTSMVVRKPPEPEGAKTATLSPAK
jgi:hypothetical protein